MLNHLASVAKLAQISQTQAGNEFQFNATLPILLKVLSRSKTDEYLLRLGNIAIKTKSQKELLINQNYWASMSKSSAGAIILSHLTQVPKMAQTLEKSPISFLPQSLLEFFEKPKALETYKDFLVEKFAQAPNHFEFYILGNLLLSLHKGIASFVITQNDRRGILQIQASKTKKQSLDFYAFYPNLGSIKGRVYRMQNGVGAEFSVSYESVKTILEKNKAALNGFEKIHIYVAKDIEPFFEFEESLLDIKG